MSHLKEKEQEQEKEKEKEARQKLESAEMYGAMTTPR